MTRITAPILVFTLLDRLTQHNHRWTRRTWGDKLSRHQRGSIVVIEVDVVVLPDRTRRRGRIDPSASLESAKRGILAKAKPGEDPEKYDLILLPQGRNPALSTIGVVPNDLLILSPREELEAPPFEWVDD